MLSRRKHSSPDKVSLLPKNSIPMILISGFERGFPSTRTAEGHAEGAEGVEVEERALVIAAGR